jgi:hypothetical protein
MIKKWIRKITDKVLEFKLTSPAVKLVCSVIAIYALLIFLFVLGVAYNAKAAGKMDLMSIIEMVKVLLGPAAIAAVGFLGKAFIDSDGDGVPDAFEELERNTVRETKPGEGEKEC